MVLISTQYLLKLLTAIDLVAVGVQQIDVAGVGTVGVRQQYVVRVSGDVVEALSYPRVVDFNAKPVFAWRAGQMWV